MEQKTKGPDNGLAFDKACGLNFDHLPTIKTEGLLGVMGALVRNLEGLRSITESQPTIMTSVALITQSYHYACAEILQTVDCDSSDVVLRGKIRARQVELINDHNSKDGFQEADRRAAFGNLNIMSSDDSLRIAFVKMLTSQIIQAWSVFEILSGDLWEAAINCNPHILAELKGRKGKGSKSENDEEKTIKLRLLQKHQYNLQNKMGSILKEEFNFTKLDEIKVAYLRAFSENDANLNRIFDYDDVKDLSCVRNVLVHKAGVVDEEFIKKMGSRATPNCEFGKPLPVDGHLAGRLSQIAIDKSFELISEVDKWIVQDKSKMEARLAQDYSI